eukprot:CAMPEP_0117050904 /NCGR_PEP_ID=MMETSP0472-20121206/35152_1 /TAXON_ID=693140 ORGANISM="Tiarina fusus, Strain LIS" /NCGR_SAMPLE_ID=MMETSP0472 /ASSEMBLY_ACC=CAM_ASM_000603 /LENGTH=62 /DNA_ID=CAMNT_0004764875 /DNA_START=409 /DNA_END=594 /DNA_ORIENTATION=+
MASAAVATATSSSPEKISKNETSSSINNSSIESGSELGSGISNGTRPETESDEGERRPKQPQ